MNQLDKEKWVEETLESLNGSKRAEMPPDLLENALRRAAFGPARVVRMAPLQIWSAAACALVLVLANLFMCIDFSHSASKPAASKEMFIKAYFDTSDAPQF